MVDSVWVTVVNKETAIERLINRNKLTREEALSRIHSQIENEERITHAHEVIDTSGYIVKL